MKKTDNADKPWMTNYQPLHEWVMNHSGACLWQIPLGGTRDDPQAFVEAWEFPGGMVAVIVVHARKMGWEIYTPTKSGRIDETLADAELRLGLRAPPAPPSQHEGETRRTFTEGPYHVESSGDEGDENPVDVMDRYGRRLARLDPIAPEGSIEDGLATAKEMHQRARGNADLFAAAPEMFEVLAVLLDAYDESCASIAWRQGQVERARDLGRPIIDRLRAQRPAPAEEHTKAAIDVLNRAIGKSQDLERQRVPFADPALRSVPAEEPMTTTQPAPDPRLPRTLATIALGPNGYPAEYPRAPRGELFFDPETLSLRCRVTLGIEDIPGLCADEAEAIEAIRAMYGATDTLTKQWGLRWAEGIE